MFMSELIGGQGANMSSGRTAGAITAPPPPMAGMPPQAPFVGGMFPPRPFYGPPPGGFYHPCVAVWGFCCWGVVS